MRDHLRDPADPGRGLLVIEVPATGVPHMVDNSYLGRDNRTTRYLTHPEVERLLARRDADLDAIDVELERAHSVLGMEGLPDTRLVVAALPVPIVRSEVLRSQLTDDWMSWLRARVDGGVDHVNKALATEPALADLTYRQWSWHRAVSGSGVRRIPRGAAVRYTSGHDLVYGIEVFESGAIWVGARDAYELPDLANPRAAPCPVFYTRRTLTIVCQTIGLLAAITEHAGLRGSYGIGLKIAGMAGAVSEPRHESGYTSPSHYYNEPVYRDDQYRQASTITTSELAGPLSPIADRLLGPLLRSMNYGDPLRSPSMPTI